jgi:hypothetical protein
MAQQLVEKKGLKNHELARTGRMALYGGGTSRPLNILTPSQINQQLTIISHSYLRPRSNHLVQIPPKPNRPQE